MHYTPDKHNSQLPIARDWRLFDTPLRDRYNTAEKDKHA